ncbi:Cell wall assembly/cell proliferation coordinating protein, KNR4-like protein [Pectobacterium parmentieri WPP163]|uniref:Cell wall assembly/cell proliferation coordinating protein, KNR4-like protein n=2 Tax=Pectobacterium parmentieri TaxID=1905730 RepID=A0A0H3IEH9_PECPM|nr:Cell wall assembly/cell proliferation coordinating protein, KNR4-like protein [Pectobacterium parmentieri WPP163]AFI92487.1 Cell wall assembly/cell proliferation coordinating protein, KNR4-like protein [Pectobacterium parmentieri]POW23734.1 SMI1/KNR4 family protein [Pectobacterium parmentieri]
MINTAGIYMNTEKFVKIVDYVRNEKPNWFLTEDNFLAKKEDVMVIEREVNGSLPDEFVFFSLKYKSGYFAFLNIYSLSPSSEWYILIKNREYQSVPECFLSFSDDETGGYYGFLKDNGHYSNNVYFYDSSSNESPISMEKNFFDFVIDKAFQPDHFKLTLTEV